LGAIAQKWFEVMRKCGDEAREPLHDGCPTACLGDEAFGYVNVFTSHVNVGSFQGASLLDGLGEIAEKQSGGSVELYITTPIYAARRKARTRGGV
jgi:hypothetical protein